MTSTGSIGDTHETTETSDTTALDLIEEQAEASIRRVYYLGAWHFSVIDVIGVLTDSTYPNRYWSDLKRKLVAEGASQTYEKIVRLKMTAPDGRERKTDAADSETLLRIIQSIPSPKAEPVKQWLARVGAKRLDEVTRPADAA
jgi:DNA-damage-inducible protein D